MADIHIQKKRTPVWPWLLLLLLIVLIVIFFVLNERRDDDRVTTVVTTDTLDYAGADRWMEPVDEFNAFATDTAAVRGTTTRQDRTETSGGDTTDTNAGAANLQRDDYVSRGFFLLSSALDAIVNRDTSTQAGNLRDRNDTLKARAESIYNDTGTRGANVRSAAMAAVNVMEQLQKNRGTETGAVKEAREAAEKINAKGNEEQIRNQVQTFFAEANDMLQSLGVATSDTTIRR